MTCSICNYLNQLHDRFCTQCGHALFQVDEPKTDGPTSIRHDGETDSPYGYKHLIRSHQLAGRSDRGLWHFQNEDAIAVEHLGDDSCSGRLYQRSVLIVCDGVSSSTHPENASSTASTAVLTALASIPPGACPRDALTSAINQAQHAVARLAESYPGNQCPRNPPATTIVAAVVQSNSQAQTIATIGWLGDSRAYWITRDKSQLLTRDDSWLNAIRISGKLSEVEALRSPYAHAITRWLGANADPVPSILEFPLSQAGYLILCSDGFWNYAAEPARIAELCQMLSGAEILAACTIAQILVQYALSCGGRDNISVAVYYHDPSPNPV